MNNLFKTGCWNLRTAIALGFAAITMFAAITEGRAQAPQLIPPKLSVPKAKFFKQHPEAWQQFLSELQQQPAADAEPYASPFGGTWTKVTGAPQGGLSNPLLLTDGTVIAHSAATRNWYKLKPDASGNYATGSWSKIAELPSGYGPLYFGSAVLPDGRVIIQGGEYNIACDSGNTEVWTSLGAIYDPIANSWKSVAHPSGAGWVNTDACGTKQADGGIGDAASIVLPNGKFLLSACCAFPAVDALLNASTLTYSATGAPTDPCVVCGSGTYQDEQGYTLLHNGKVLTIDVWDPPHAQTYDPSTGTWSDVASTPVSLIDPTQCGNFEIGPAVTRPDGTVVAFGGNTGCTSSPADPTAIYNPATNTWATGPNVPEIGGAFFTLPDAPASLLPNGNVLFAASPRYGHSPTHFFEFTSATSSPANTIKQVSDPLLGASTGRAYYYNLLALPNGQTLMTDFSSVAEVYSPTGGPNSAWKPVIKSAPKCVTPGDSYVVSGTQLNGLSQGAAYGDDVQGATNYPLVRIVNNSSGHVFYARTFDPSTMSIAPGQSGSTHFTVSKGTPTGAGKLYVVANGIASQAFSISVKKSCPSD